jgi:hypothetical protein
MTLLLIDSRSITLLTNNLFPYLSLHYFFIYIIYIYNFKFYTSLFIGFWGFGVENSISRF